MNREEAIKTLKENSCNICSFLAKDMESCSIAYCDNREAIRTLEQESCEDSISRKAVLDNAYAYGNGLEPEGYCVNVEDIQALPSVTSTRKTGKWIDTGETSTNRRGQIMHEVICSECNSLSYFRSMGNKYIGANLCPNCGSRNEVEK